MDIRKAFMDRPRSLYAYSHKVDKINREYKWYRIIGSERITEIRTDKEQSKGPFYMNLHEHEVSK